MSRGCVTGTRAAYSVGVGVLLDAIGGLSFLAGVAPLSSNSTPPPAPSSAVPVAVVLTTPDPKPLPVQAMNPRNVMAAYGVTHAEIDASRAPDLSFQDDVRRYRRWYGDVAEINLMGVFGQRYEPVRRVAMGESNEELPDDYVKGYRAAHE